MPSANIDIATLIKAQARGLGFDACGFAAAEPVADEAVAHYGRWLGNGHNGCMQWAENHPSLRRDPSLLLDGAKTVISLALNYFPARFQPDGTLRVACYAYGRDYHEVMREKLTQLARFIQQIDASAQCRPCVDSAPVRERYWAQRAGLGFIGRNNCLIIPGKGSFFFLGELITTLELSPDEPCTLTCGDCGRCVLACPVSALHTGAAADCSRCLSCLLIEDHSPTLPAWAGRAAAGRIVGCDACQLCCPHNAHAIPTTEHDLAITGTVATLTRERALAMTPGDFRRAFAHSAIARLRHASFIRNAEQKPTHPEQKLDKSQK